MQAKWKHYGKKKGKKKSGHPSHRIVTVTKQPPPYQLSQFGSWHSEPCARHCIHSQGGLCGPDHIHSTRTHAAGEARMKGETVVMSCFP